MNAIADWTSGNATSFVGGPFSFVSVLLLALLDIIVREKLGEACDILTNVLTM
jgi:hypothetical protein